MARQPRAEDWADDAYAAPRRGSRGALGWVLFVLLAGAVAAFVYYIHLPLSKKSARLDAELAAAAAREKRAERQLNETTQHFSLLEQERNKVKGELQQTVVEKERVESELKRVQDELAQKLEPEIQTGSVRLRRRGNELVLDMTDQILFPTAQAEISERGEKLLAQVAQSLAELRTYAVQVGGHTDGSRVVNPATQERFPTNWELASARSTNVVRFLQEKGKIPGERLVVAGFAEFRPAASNATEEGRQQNRRIEIVLLPRTSDTESRIR